MQACLKKGYFISGVVLNTSVILWTLRDVLNKVVFLIKGALIKGVLNQGVLNKVCS